MNFLTKKGLLPFIFNESELSTTVASDGSGEVYKLVLAVANDGESGVVAFRGGDGGDSVDTLELELAICDDNNVANEAVVFDGIGKNGEEGGLDLRLAEVGLPRQNGVVGGLDVDHIDLFRRGEDIFVGRSKS